MDIIKTEWHNALQNCQNCERGLGPRNTPQEGKITGKTKGWCPYGSNELEPRTYMIVKTQPDFKGQINLTPFGSKKGERFVQWLEKKVKFPLKETFLTCLVKCAIKNNDVTNIQSYYFRRCKGWFYAELGIVKPRLIIALGKVTWEVLGGEFDRFTTFPDPFNWGTEFAVYGTWTPDYVDRNRDKIDDYKDMFKKAMKWAKETNLSPL